MKDKHKIVLKLKYVCVFAIGWERGRETENKVKQFLTSKKKRIEARKTIVCDVLGQVAYLGTSKPQICFVLSLE